MVFADESGEKRGAASAESARWNDGSGSRRTRKPETGGVGR